MTDLSHVQLPPGKRIASLFLLPDCDMACRFCGSDLGFSVMTFEAAQDLLHRLRDLGLDQVVLGGGEPLLWPYRLPRLAAAARRLGFTVQVCTNGLRLTEELLRDEAIDRFILPMESLDAETHDRLRRAPGGHHHRIRERIGRAVALGRELTFSTVVTAENLTHLPALADHLEDLARNGARIHAWHLYRFLPIGRGGLRNAELLATSAQAYRAAVEAVRRGHRGFPIYRRSDMVHASSVAYFWAEDGRIRMA